MRLGTFFKLIVSLLVLAAVGVIGVQVYFHKINEGNQLVHEAIVDQQNINDIKSENQVEYVRNTITEKLKSLYAVNDFADILFADKNDLIGYIYSIEPTPNKDKTKTKVVVRFSNLYDSTTQTAAKEVAAKIMRLMKPSLPYLTSVTARFDTYDGQPYYQETVKREEV
jgi:L-cystine uptake protein TcyP (sodium:dicarboxylate symporter family)